jgi:hypothetical protein
MKMTIIDKAGHHFQLIDSEVRYCHLDHVAEMVHLINQREHKIQMEKIKAKQS